MAISLLAVVATCLIPRFDAPQSYHDFADKRALAGIANFGDVISNLAFLVAGLYGLNVLRRGKRFQSDQEVAPYILLFVGMALTAFGSSYYHLAPDNARLFWDRLPMTVCFMGLFAAMISERISVSLGNRLLPLLIAIGVASLMYWRWTIGQGRGDLRPYALVQAYPLVAVGLLLWLFQARYTRGGDFLLAFGCYAAAKIFETADKPIFALTGHTVSGHTLKHLAAGLGGIVLARMLRLRQPIHANETAKAASS